MNTNSINSRNWELLLNALDEGRVVPVIGDALIMVKGPDGKEENVTDYLMRRLQENGFRHISFRRSGLVGVITAWKRDAIDS